MDYNLCDLKHNKPAKYMRNTIFNGHFVSAGPLAYPLKKTGEP